MASTNFEYATSISLRGLGPGSTLVLLNGQRRPGNVLGRAFDISSIPLSAIERVDVLTGGHSAIYGSDAVAGVVNLVTRHDFDGVESDVSYGMGQNGGDQVQASQTFGRYFESGGFIAAYDYSKDWHQDATEAGVVHAPSPSGLTPVPGRYFLLPEATRHSGFLSGSLQLGERTELFADGLYTDIQNESTTAYTFPTSGSATQFENSGAQFSISPGVRIDFGGTWRSEIGGVHGRTKNTLQRQLISTAGSASAITRGTIDEDAHLSSASAAVDGTLLSTSYTHVKAAFGLEYREEEFTYDSKNTLGVTTTRVDGSRTVESAFSEFLVSLFPSARRPEQHHVQLSAAGRYSQYSKIGHSFNPQFGVTWDSLNGVILRGTYATAFRAPDLYTASDINQTAILFTLPDPLGAGGQSPTLFRSGNNSQLQPEEAKTWSFGVDYIPQFASQLRFSASYFAVEYRDRIDVPATVQQRTTLLPDERLYPGLIDRTPSDAELQSFLELAGANFGNSSGVPFNRNTQNLLTVFPNIVVFDNRFNNIGVESMRGVDLSIDGKLLLEPGTLSFGLLGTRNLKMERRITSTAAAIEQLGILGKPVKTRMRANVGWTRNAFGISAYMNYVDSYRDTGSNPAGSVASWKTTDIVLQLNGSELATDGLVQGLTATLSARNVFDKAPPLVPSNLNAINYDPANANALGRFLTLSVTKRW